MDCKTARGLLSEHIDGALDEVKRAALEAHLKSCAGCGSELKDLLSVSAAVKKLPRHRAPAGFAASVTAGLPQLTRREDQRLFGWLWSMPVHLKLAEAAAVAAAAVIAIYSAGLLSNVLGGDGALVRDTEDNIMASVSLEYLEPMPPESLGDVYFSKENGNEQQAD